MSSEKQSSPPSRPSLDCNGDNPTRWEKRLSEAQTPDEDLADSEKPENWNRQQKRAFHRVNTLLHYWESRDYEILWVTLTSCPESDDADKLAYNVQRLRQTIERARLAYDGDGEAHSLSHIDRLEQLSIRTSEGPEGKGVVHLFWAWEPHEGQHSRSLYIPQKWLSEQWGRIHGPFDEHDVEAAKPLYVWVERYGQEEYHDRGHVARYCVTQYLGEHGEALEHVSWSHGRTLGGSLVEAWEAIRDHSEGLESAVEKWERVVAGEAVTLGSNSDNIDYGLTVEPPPNLGVSESESPTVTPPEDYERPGPHQNTVRRLSPPGLESVPDDGLCPDCSEYYVLEQVGEQVECTSCGSVWSAPGHGRQVVEVEFSKDRWDLSAD